MAVAVKNKPETYSPSLLGHLAVGSLVGMVYVLASLFVVFFALPSLAFGQPFPEWNVLDLDPGLFVNIALVIGVMAVALGALAYGAVRWFGGPQAAPGLRAGIFVAIAFLFLVTLVTQAIGITLEKAGFDATIGLGVTAVVGVVLLVVAYRPFFRAGFERWLVRLEEQGWFSTTGYKANQGLRVRRGTILGLLAVACCGIYTMLLRNPLLGDWELEVPFLDGWVLVLLPFQKYTLTLLLLVGAFWFSWRVVNFPTFADFLIATEAEMNKVSWTTRKRLVQDTVVVLVTVFLMTLFLLIVDVLWFKVLSNPWIKVLRIDTTGQTGVSDEGQRQGW
jgi:preprotein translocase SecE subunit